jgi:CHRD domain
MAAHLATKEISGWTSWSIMRGIPMLTPFNLVVFTASALLASAAMAQQTEHGGKPITVELTGAAEAPTPGDADGKGTATLRFNPGQGQICYELKVSGIDAANAAHIHVGPPGQAGDVAVPLEAPNAEGTSKACATVDREVLKQIMDSPSDYYVNVHNAKYPNGALRGQLAK